MGKLDGRYHLSQKKHGKFDGKSSINHIYICIYGTYHNLSNFLMPPQKGVGIMMEHYPITNGN